MAKETEVKKDPFLAALEEVNKKYGAEAVQDGDAILDIERLKTGSLSLDLALGGGWGVGKIAELYGPESCLSGDTFIPYALRKECGKLRNKKGGTLKLLFEKFNKLPLTKRHARFINPLEGDFYTVPCINEMNRIEHIKIKDVVYNGVKPVYNVLLENGMQIKATLDHKFYDGSKYTMLGNLVAGDIVHIHNNTTFKVDEYQYKYYKEVFVKYHPSWKQKIVNGCTYYRNHVSRAIFEANMNGYDYKDFVKLLNSGPSEEASKLLTIPEKHHIHHIDEDITNNSLENLCLISSSDHGKIHANERHNNLRFISVPKQIVSIDYVGEEEVFDIKCEDPYHNYVANGFIVHNCGKTTLCISSAVEAQKAFPDKKVLIIDAEHALDRRYCKNLGLDMKNVVISQPDNGEQGLEILETFISSGRISIAIIDSIAALTPKSEIEGEMGDSQMGKHARLMSQAMRKLTGIANKTKTTLLFTNQLRSKLGVMFGNPETTTGGNAMKFYASTRVDMRKKQGDKVDEVVQNIVSSCKVVKNKLAPPFQKCEFTIEFGEGIDKASEILTLGVATRLIERGGSWFSYQGVKIGNGITATKDILRDNPQLMEEIEDIIRKNISVYDDIEQIAE